MKEYIRIRQASEHNLKSVDLDIPRNAFVVFTGLSGSGKSSLAFDTIYAEGQRRYMESLSSYARQFLGQMEKPKVTSIEGLSPAISIDQKSTNRNPRSTVGTVTEIYDYLRLLYARIGIPHCPVCGREIRKQTVDEMVDQLMSLPEGTRIQLLSPVVRGRKGTHEKLLEQASRSGYVRARVDGNIYELTEEIRLDKNQKHDIEIIVDRLIIKPGLEARLTDSLENVLKLSGGIALAGILRIGADTGEGSGSWKDGDELTLSQSFACPDCGISIEEIEPRSFSFNNPFGACPDCFGLGVKMEFDLRLMIPDTSLSLNEGAIQVTGWQSSGKKDSYSHAMLEGLSEAYHFSLDTPYEKLSPEARNVIENGTGDRKIRIRYESKYRGGLSTHEAAFEGLVENTRRRYREAYTQEMKSAYEVYMRTDLCPCCHGQRLKASSLAVTVGGENIHAMTNHSIAELKDRFDRLELSGFQITVGSGIIKEIRSRLNFLINVGLDYLTLSRSTATLSGGEAQRIRLATQIGSGLVGVVYILDEPSIGLHQRDNEKLLATLKNLRNLGNTVIVVEHDEDTMRSADFLVDIGPGAGEHGGEIVACGTVDDIIRCERSVTGAYLSGKRRIEVPAVRRKPRGWLTIRNAAENNLKNIDVSVPLGVFTCVTGVSGSGKSSLINQILYKALAAELNRAATIAGKHDSIEGTEQLDKIITIDQSPIGRTPRSNPATYTGAFDLIRDLFAKTPDAKMRGYDKGRFSFNVKGGRCEACSGDGIIKIEMHFLPDVYVPCEICHGRRYNRETLEVKYKGKSIYEVLNMTVEDALEFFRPIEQIRRKIQTLYDVGLGYIRLGQPSTELSGGEAQRIKLAAELSRRPTGRTIYVLDEPTTGLHFEDVRKLTEILQRLTESGNTVVVIEHNLDVIKTADYIIDMGPEGGDRGGTVIAEGTPEEICECSGSFTGKFLKPMLKESSERKADVPSERKADR